MMRAKQSIYGRRFEPALCGCPIVVFESDDWGACEVVPDSSLLPDYRAALARHGCVAGLDCRLETVEDLARLQAVLASHQGRDGLPPVFTAYTCIGNPDFESIEASGFTCYRDVPLAKGVPIGWNGAGIVEAMCDGMARGVWEPEYHA
ncbi:MAG: hypothetical protein IJJ33_19195, partial [Victivallales bacterium]|nr:hypothetical protein [Victivallales bacterium]